MPGVQHIRATRLTLTALLALCAGLAALALTAPAARASQGMELATEDEDTFVLGTSLDPAQGYRRLGELQVSRLRIQVGWARLMRSGAEARRAPANPSYDFRGVDNAIDQAAAHGIRIELTVAGPAPAWATANHKSGDVKPNAKLFGRFMRTVADHFKGRVDRYGIWNEPNFKGWIEPQKTAPLIYRKLYVQGYNQIKAADPTALVLMGETSPYAKKGKAIAPLDFLRGMLCLDNHYHKHGHCGALKLDGYAHHPYDLFSHPPTVPIAGNSNVTIASLDRLTATLDKLQRLHVLVGPRPIPVYLDEFGYTAIGTTVAPQETRASYLTEAFKIAQRNPRVKQLSQYLLASPPFNANARTQFNTAILGEDGGLTAMFRSLRDWAKDAAMAGEIAGPSQTPIQLPPAPAPTP